MSAEEDGAASAGVGRIFTAESVRGILAGRKSQTRRIVKWNGLAKRPSGYEDATVVHVPASSGITPLRKDAGFVARWPNGHEVGVRCPFAAGGLLYVKETWYDDTPGETDRERLEDGRVEGVEYRATHDCASFEAGCPCNPDGDGKRSEWRSSLFMPRAFARLWLRVVSVRAERLHDITEDDARAEGIESGCYSTMSEPCTGYVGSGCRKCGRIIRADDPQTMREIYAKKWDEINGKRVPWSQNPWVWVIDFERAEAHTSRCSEARWIGTGTE